MKKILLLPFFIVPLTAQAFSLTWPVRCELGKDCFVQNFVDHDTSAAWQDYACETSSYDKHDGTDIRLKNMQAMRAGVDVLAAADGKVLRLRDGVDDINFREQNPAALKDRECGNGMVIEHADQYQTMYCHLKKSSIIVRVGDEVKAGDKLAQIGLSGNTEFPHLHLTLWKGKEKLDPFTADSINAPCGKKQIKGLWKKLIPYTPTAILGDGFVDAVPKVNAMRDTPSNLSQISATAPVIAYWVELMGTRQGDQLSFSITQPDGKELASVRQTVKKSQAVFFQFIGKRNRTGLAAGKYQAKFTLARAGKPLLSAQREVFVK